jgi:hypothetical protein
MRSKDRPRLVQNLAKVSPERILAVKFLGNLVEYDLGLAQIEVAQTGSFSASFTERCEHVPQNCNGIVVGFDSVLWLSVRPPGRWPSHDKPHRPGQAEFANVLEARPLKMMIHPISPHCGDRLAQHTQFTRGPPPPRMEPLPFGRD